MAVSKLLILSIIVVAFSFSSFTPASGTSRHLLDLLPPLPHFPFPFSYPPGSGVYGFPYPGFPTYPFPYPVGNGIPEDIFTPPLNTDTPVTTTATTNTPAATTSTTTHTTP
ncbi:hypothetical protein POM88_035534 [Heracleum sosnowskyi]|uniref:Uncharacterized protein n=1 Tax=Heracleum sosnowskyi TaxID=360622 RepID=A0AAD8HLF9_9APIA|nr:hypothetical protein POM88_035534 [Heracleum sosnowskyi]